jgi:hypothetical protein
MGVLVHRIDKDTSGLLVVAKNDEAQLNLAKQFFVHSIERRYVAIVWGNLKEDEGTIVGNIGRDPNDRMRFKVFPDGDHGKHAVTHYKVLERFGYVTVVECRLETGRTHQIRVHFNWIGHPLFNDERYDGSEIRKGTIYAKYRQFIENCFKLLPRQALHAKTLGFVHPRTKEMIRLAAKRGRGTFFVANLASIPVQDSSFDYAVHLFAPFKASEFSRVLKPGGALYTVVPGSHHLFGLKSALYDTPYLNDEALPDSPGFRLVGTKKVTASIVLKNKDDIEAVFRMTPYYFHTSQTDREKLSTYESLQTQIEFLIAHYVKSDG